MYEIFLILHNKRKNIFILLLFFFLILLGSMALEKCSWFNDSFYSISFRDKFCTLETIVARSLSSRAYGQIQECLSIAQNLLNHLSQNRCDQTPFRNILNKTFYHWNLHEWIYCANKSLKHLHRNTAFQINWVQSSIPKEGQRK